MRERWNKAMIPPARLTVLNRIKTASWILLGFTAVTGEALKGMEIACSTSSGMTGELVERDSPRSMLKCFLDHACVQVAGGQRLLKRRPGSKPSKRRPGDFYLFIYHAKGGCDCRKNLNGNLYP